MDSANSGELAVPSDLAMTECQGTAYIETDGILNASYRQLVATLKQQVLEEQKSGMTPSGTKTYAEEILSRLVASERAWIPFRDAECNFKAAVCWAAQQKAPSIRAALQK